MFRQDDSDSADRKPGYITSGVFDGWSAGKRGISRHIETIAGESYSLSFDMAGNCGVDVSSTAIGVLLDGKLIASYDLTSPEGALNWQRANVKFIGCGGRQTLTIVAESGDQGEGGDRLLDYAAPADANGPEIQRLVLSGMPVGTTLTDGTHSVTTTAANPSVDITGWDTSKLSITTPASYNDTLTLRAASTALESAGGRQASVGQDLTVQANAIAQVPFLTLSLPAGRVSRSLISTSWEKLCNNGYDATVLATSQFAGWSATPVGRGKNPAFEIWSNGDRIKNAQGGSRSVQAAPGAGQEWLGLSNGVGSVYQAPGIAQTFHTIADAQYTFNLDYAGQLGLSRANTQIGLYIDERLLGVYSNASMSSLNWQTLGFRFKGDGNSHTLSIQLSNGTNTRTPRGALLDALRLVETLPDSASTVYGFAGSAIALPQISSQLTANDSGPLSTTLIGLPVGAIVKDGSHSAIISSANTVLNITAWRLSGLTVTIPQNTQLGDSNCSSFEFQVVATSMGPSSGSMASVAKNVAVRLLSGQSCATPAGVNPYVSYANRNSAQQTTGPGDSAGAPAPLSSSYAIVTPSGTTAQLASGADLNASLDKLLDSLNESVGAALLSELSKLKH